MHLESLYARPNGHPVYSISPGWHKGSNLGVWLWRHRAGQIAKFPVPRNSNHFSGFHGFREVPLGTQRPSLSVLQSDSKVASRLLPRPHAKLRLTSVRAAVQSHKAGCASNKRVPPAPDPDNQKIIEHLCFMFLVLFRF